MAATDAIHANDSALGAALSEPDYFLEVLDGLSDAVYLVDRRRTIMFWNRECERITGYSAAEVVGRHCFDNILRHIDENGQHLCFGSCPLAHTMKDGTPRHVRVWLHHKEGHRLAVRVGVNAVHDREGKIIGAIETFADDSALTATQEKVSELEHIAMVDALTGIPNRRFLDLTLSSRLAELRRHGSPFSVVFGDIDNFKRFNDEHGHDVGDRILRMVATTLSADLRGNDTVVRFGGEEFVMLLHHAAGPAPTAACERFRQLVAASSLDTDDGHLRVTISLGATMAMPSDSPSSVLRRADKLLYQSKRSGRNRVSTDIDPAEPAAVLREAHA